MQVNLKYAEEHFADLASAVDSGQEVEIARPDKPTLKLVVSNAPSDAKKPGKRILGAGRGELRVPSVEEWKAMDKELEHQMNDSPLFPPESR
jgi:antitoxin (DNA-binding transcriptional repressor) of toxin-antitoxin stability system